ncbi:MAG: hypothetical protein NTX03_03460 [Bacteroidetes bacterium]|nr:hypothetical protein [Bacteroidota bacterium]
MRKATQLFVVIFTLLVSLNLKAGDTISIPKFVGEVVVLRINQVSSLLGSGPTITISDETGKPITSNFIENTHSNDGEITYKLAVVISNLKKQGYKLISSNAIGYVGGTSYGISTAPITTYIFQKE